MNDNFWDPPKTDPEPAAIEPQPEKPKAKVKYKKPEPVPVALKNAEVHLDDGTQIRLVEGQPIPGLRRQERNHLKFHGFIE